ncbi:MAG: NAD-dependent deacylase [Bacteroidota bacterium]|nr:NAD-dependent deacylase [Bacteroidota bacterium]MDX5431866.1 NAD-dependent deacylase [Bacteroidota bacterium]MDX5470580.1 NAD-dependent deacylase [Bacteroidota bacterium]
MLRKKLVVLTGAGISAESGLKTFRDAGGLWEGHDVHQVATPEAWQKDPEMVLRFYNERRHQSIKAEPNAAHLALAELEKYFDVSIITQNIDDLHERAGSSHVIHLHGEIKKARSTADPHLVYPIKGGDLNWGDLCEKGSQLRPHIVWFGEPVPAMEEAELICSFADIFVVIGTSLQVYPAAGLIYEIPSDIPRYYVDPKANESAQTDMEIIAKPATEGVPELVEILKPLASTPQFEE